MIRNTAILIASLALAGAWPPDSPLSPLAAAQARQDAGKGSDTGAAAKGKSKSAKADKGANGATGAAHGKGDDKQDRAGELGAPSGAHADDRRGTHGDRRDLGKWAGDWEASAFVKAGFTALALTEILRGETRLLETGAKPLPPGIRKNLARGKPLPPGIAKRYPGPDLVACLPRVVDHEWYAIGTDLVLVQIGTLIVAELILDVLS